MSAESEESIPTQLVIEARHLHAWNEALEAAIVEDFFTPPVAGRLYTYPNIAAYEVLSQGRTDYASVTTVNASLAPVEVNAGEVNLEMASLFAFYYTAVEQVYAIKHLQDQRADFIRELEAAGVGEEMIQRADDYGKQAAQRILKWANADLYKEMRSFPKYVLKEGKGLWVPTPPDYSDAMEPYWNQLRPFALDSASQFRPAPPTAFDLTEGSTFYTEMMEVYQTVAANDSSTVLLARFWDCNPLVRMHQGHVTYAEKKLTPGGHWVNIARIAMRKESLDLMESAHAYVMVTVAINDAFISCWDEKYNSNYIRPVTVIQEHIDPNWTPILYTPNFPEYPSGHSVVSGSAATVLTNIFGENYAYIDSTEFPYGMAPRSFNSFYQASEEAAISRMYGGIHFTPAIENGKVQGRQVGAHVLKNWTLKKEVQ